VFRQVPFSVRRRFPDRGRLLVDVSSAESMSPLRTAVKILGHVLPSTGSLRSVQVA